MEAIQNVELPFIKGEFLYVGEEVRDMLINGYKAVNELELWWYIKKPIDSFMFCNDININKIYKKMEELGYKGHSGYSFGWTMRQLEFIANYGEEEFKKKYISFK